MLLIISIGNSLRGDDGAGRVLADRIERWCAARGQSCRRIRTHQLTPDLAADIAVGDVTGVVFADARVGEEAGFTPVVQVRSLGGAEYANPVAHHLTPETLLAYARLLRHARPIVAWQVTVPGFDFGFGKRISVRTEQALQNVDAVLDASLAPGLMSSAQPI
ncbi:MAG: hypothetical protein J5I90_13475 [Caldilineales bacterium]|nr:hypothetical protein [Caldilineales bacterium]